jgi:deoxycytidine triphosphate deaminase
MLESGKRYEVIFEGIVDIKEGEAGWVITRSTLNRNGLFLTSGLYDSGYTGVMAGCLHVTSGPARIKKGTRLGQFILFEAESLSSYDGDYGVGKEHDEKYNDE